MKPFNFVVECDEVSEENMDTNQGGSEYPKNVFLTVGKNGFKENSEPTVRRKADGDSVQNMQRRRDGYICNVFQIQRLRPRWLAHREVEGRKQTESVREVMGIIAEAPGAKVRPFYAIRKCVMW